MRAIPLVELDVQISKFLNSILCAGSGSKGDLTSLEQSGAIFLQKQNALGRPALDDIAKGNVSVSSDEDACECVVCLADVRTKQGHSDRD